MKNLNSQRINRVVNDDVMSEILKHLTSEWIWMVNKWWLCSAVFELAIHKGGPDGVQGETAIQVA